MSSPKRVRFRVKSAAPASARCNSCPAGYAYLLANPFSSQEFAYRHVDFGPLLRRKVPVFSSGDGHQLVRHSDLLKSFLQPHGVAVGDGGVGVALDRENGWQLERT